MADMWNEIMSVTLNKLIFNLKTNGFPFDVVYDIGACRGTWSLQMRYNAVLQNTKFYLFEGNKEYEQILKEQNFTYFITLLSNPGRGEVDFYNGTNTGDSYYQETTTHYDKFVPVRIPTTTIDEMIETHNLPIPDFVKIDTQGSELDIFKGATKIIGKTPLILTEMPIIEYNKGAPVISDYLNFFKENDYVPIDLIEVHRAEETLLQLDIMFMLRTAKHQFLGGNPTIRV